MNPDLGGYCSQYKLHVPEKMSRREEQTEKVETGGKRFNIPPTGYINMETDPYNPYSVT